MQREIIIQTIATQLQLQTLEFWCKCLHTRSLLKGQKSLPKLHFLVYVTKLLLEFINQHIQGQCTKNVETIFAKTAPPSQSISLQVRDKKSTCRSIRTKTNTINILPHLKQEVIKLRLFTSVHRRLLKFNFFWHQRWGQSTTPTFTNILPTTKTRLLHWDTILLRRYRLQRLLHWRWRKLHSRLHTRMHRTTKTMHTTIQAARINLLHTLHRKLILKLRLLQRLHVSTCKLLHSRTRRYTTTYTNIFYTSRHIFLLIFIKMHARILQRQPCYHTTQKLKFCTLLSTQRHTLTTRNTYRRLIHALLTSSNRQVFTRINIHLTTIKVLHILLKPSQSIIQLLRHITFTTTCFTTNTFT